MAKINPERMAAEIEGEFVVFLIGARINSYWRLGNVIWFLRQMPKMLKELEATDPEVSGFLGHNGLSMSCIVQYWRSFDHLEAYARAKDQAHFPAWAAFNKRFKSRRGDVGIWHETYLVRAGQYEAIYSGMPPHGLGRVGALVPATGKREAARARLGA